VLTALMSRKPQKMSHISMSELCSRVIENEVDMLKTERVCAHQTQQQ
jgi:hypothetical protein